MTLTEIKNKSIELNNKNGSFPVAGSLELNKKVRNPDHSAIPCDHCGSEVDTQHLRLWSRKEFTTTTINCHLCKSCLHGFADALRSICGYEGDNVVCEPGY